jgi:hypothetical protein
MNLLTLQHTTAGTVSRNLTSYGSNDGALSALYQSMRSSINAPEILSITALLISDDGYVAKCERWAREVAEKTTEPTENSAQLG